MKKRLIFSVTLTGLVLCMVFANPLYGAPGVSDSRNQAPFTESTEKICPKGHGPKFDYEEKRALFLGVKEEIANILGINESELESLKDEGLSLAEIAEKKNIKLNLLKAAIQTRIEQNIDQAVKNGIISNEDASNIKEKLPEKIEKMIFYQPKKDLYITFKEKGLTEEKDEEDKDNDNDDND